LRGTGPAGKRPGAGCELAQSAWKAIPERVTPIQRLFFLPLLVLAGCTSTERATMNVGIAEISIADAAMSETEATITLRFTNEALFPLVVESDTHKIHVNGLFIGEGTSSEAFALPQLGTVMHAVKVRLADRAAVERLREVIAQGGGECRIESRLVTNAFDDKTIVINTSTGRFALKGR